jgi:hypothetical protein
MITTSARQAAVGGPRLALAHPRGQVEARGDRPHPGREAEQARGGDHRQLLKDPLVVVGDLGADSQAVREGQRHQPDVGDQHSPPRDGEHGEQRAEHRQVRERVQQVLEEDARPFVQVMELPAEGDDPADDEQGDRHDVAVGQPGQHGAGVVPLLALGQHHDPGGRGRQGEQRRHVGERQWLARGTGPGEHLLDDQPGEPEQGRAA